MTSTQRFAIPPVLGPGEAVRPVPIDRRDLNNAWLLIGQGVVMFWLFIGFGAVTLGNTTVLGLAAMGLGAMIVLAPRGTFSQVRISLPIVLFGLWWLASYRWTLSTGSWWVRTKSDLANLGVPIIVAAVLPIERITQAFRWSFYAVVLLTLGATAASPGTTTVHVDSAGVFQLTGWHGTFIHKNDMAFFLLIGLVSVHAFEPRKWLRIGSHLMTLALILLGRSGTGILAFVVLTCFMAWLKAHRRQPRSLRRWFAAVSSFFSIGIIGILIPLHPLLLQLGGKDPTISGRTEIWSSVWIALRAHPWTGYGPGGVWDNQAAEPTKSIVQRIGFIVFHAHAGPLELALQLGFVGLILVIWITAGATRHGWWLQRARTRTGFWIIALMMLMLVTWFSENTLTGEWIGLLGLLLIIGRRERERLVAAPTEPPPPARPRVL